MSEPSSLYVRVQLTPGSFDAFLSSAPIDPAHYDDWQAWLATHTFHGTISDEDIRSLHHSAGSVRDYVAGAVASPFNGPASSHYDPATNTWILRILQCSENYGEFIQILSVVRAVATYQDIPGDGCILLYPYLWGGPPNAYLNISAGTSTFCKSIPTRILHEATRSFDTLYQAYSAQFDDNTA